VVRKKFAHTEAVSQEIRVPEIIGITFTTANVLLLVVATLVLIKVGLQLKKLSRSTKQLQETADRIARLDRSSARKIVRIAKEISADIGKLRDIDSSDDGVQFQSLH
jgi:hypothetical protein